MAKIQLPGGLTATTFPAPPEGFDPSKASAKDLALYGFPPRPMGSGPDAHAWERIFATKMQRTEPEFSPGSGNHAPQHSAKQGGGGTITEPNWCGAIVESAKAQFTGASGEWTVPNAGPQTNDNANYYSAFLVGIGGVEQGSHDLFAAGVECDAAGEHGNTRSVYAWWEWFPAPSIRISNFPLAAGDRIYCYIGVRANTNGTILMVNFRANLYTSFEVTAPTGTVLTPDSAQWIVARTQVNGVYSRLADFGAVNFTCYAWTANASLGPGDGARITMAEGVNVYAVASVPSRYSVKCLYHGPHLGIGTYDVTSPDDRVIPFDYGGTAKPDHLFLYRPGPGIAYVVQKDPDLFTPVFSSPGGGVGGYDLSNGFDRAIPFDYDSSGKLDHLVFYRPGFGIVYILKRQGDGFVAIFGGSAGIGNYDLRDQRDRIIPYDWDSSGKLDHLVLYRPGIGTAYVVHREQNDFAAIYGSADGLAGYSPNAFPDRIIPFDYESSGKLDHLVLYRPSRGAIYILRRQGTSFTSVFSSNGIGGFDLMDGSDKVIPYDYESTGKLDHLVLYRPGSRIVWIVGREGAGFTSVFPGNQPGAQGIGGYDLGDPRDRIIPYDYNSSGKLDHLLLYRPGAGIVYILKKNPDATFGVAYPP